MRNEVLEAIGTTNFDYRLNSAIRQEKIAKNLPAVQEWIESISAVKGERSWTYSSMYDTILRIDIKDFKPEKCVIPKKHEKDKLFYYIDTSFGECSLMVKIKKKDPQQSPKEKERMERIAQARAEYDEMCRTAYECRLNFVKTLRYRKMSEAAKLLDGAVLAIVASAFCYTYTDKTELSKVLGWEWDYGHPDESKQRLIEDITENQIESCTPLVIYHSFNDGPDDGYGNGYKKEHPRWQSNTKLDLLYRWLELMGYEMSDEEKAMQDGTHEIFKVTEETK